MTHTTATSPNVFVRNPALFRHASLAVSGSLLVALAAHVSFPLFFTPVPVTLQTFAVLALGLILGPVTAGSALLLYLFEGAAGLPVFSPHGPGGLLQLMGPTGGYLMSYPLAAAAAGQLFARARKIRGWSSFSVALGASAAASFLILLAGAAWMALISHLPPAQIAAASIVPFLPGDALKAIAAAALATGAMRARKLQADSAS
jgi:biotin transport system substrate-specific component